MKLLFRQRAFSWFDSYDIYDENETTVYVVKGQLSWGHCLKIYDPEEQQELGTVKEEILTWRPKFELYEGETCIGHLEKEWSWFKPKYNIDFNGWHVEGDFAEWDYTITGPDGGTGHRIQGAVPLDGHLHSGHCRPGRCALCADVRAGHRCGKVLAELTLSVKAPALSCGTNESVPYEV